MFCYISLELTASFHLSRSVNDYVTYKWFIDDLIIYGWKGWE